MNHPVGAKSDSRTAGRLVFYVPNLHVGGAEQVTISIGNGLASRGYDVELLVSHGAGKLGSRLDSSVTLTTLSDSRVPVAGVGAHVPAIARHLRRHEPAAILPQMTHASVTCLAAARFADVETAVFPTKHCAIGHGTTTMKSRALTHLARRLFPTADQVVAVSEGVAESLVDTLSLSPDDVSVLHNPVDVDAVREQASERIDHEWIAADDLDVVLWVGRLEAQKDHDTWLRAFARVHEAAPETRAIIAGTGSRRADLEELARDLGIADVVDFPGYVDNAYAYMRGADTFLLTSRFEGLPTVLIEALAAGCPVVATDCPAGPREVLADGRYGRLVDVGNEAAIADAVLATLAEPPASARLRRRARDFKPAVVLDEYEQFLETHVVRSAGVAAGQ